MDNEDEVHFTMRLCVGSKRMHFKLLIRRWVIRAVLYALAYWFRND